MVESGLAPNAKPKRVTELAEQIKEKENFDPIFKICSKILHRTAMSIASSTMRNGLEGVIPFLSNSSVNDLLSIYDSINNPFKTRGVRPPEN